MPPSSLSVDVSCLSEWKEGFTLVTSSAGGEVGGKREAKWEEK